MKNIIPFSNFSLYENAGSQIPEKALDVILDAMEKKGETAIYVYKALYKSASSVFQQLENRAVANGRSLKSILIGHIENDPTLTSMLDETPELKQEILDKTGLEDFSKIGKLKKYF